MPTERKPVEIVVCLGSSCFARGNTENLEIIKKFAQSHTDEVVIRLSGSLCQDQCKHGPNIMIDGQLYHGITAARLRELLQPLGTLARGPHGGGTHGAS